MKTMDTKSSNHALGKVIKAIVGGKTKCNCNKYQKRKQKEKMT